MRPKNNIKAVFRLLHRHQKLRADIYIFTLPRAGSTLLSEILNLDPHTKTASESLALNKDNLKVLKRYFRPELLAERYVDLSQGQLHELFRYYEELSKGKTWNAFYWKDFLKSSHSFRTERTAFKTHKVTYHFDDIMQYFSNDLGLYLLRHPVSHSLSRYGEEWDSYIRLYSRASKIRSRLSSKALTIIDEVVKSEGKLEKMLVSWVLENHVFLHKYQEGAIPENLMPLLYEDLVSDPEKSIRQICEFTGMEFNPKMLALTHKPSAGIIHSSKETEKQIKSGNKDYIINRWTEEIDEAARERMSEILQSFGFDLNDYRSIFSKTIQQ